MRTQLDDLQRQLATGKRPTSYAGLGLDRGLTIGLRSQLSAISGYQQSITQVGVRLELMQNELTQFDKVTRAASPRSCCRSSRWRAARRGTRNRRSSARPAGRHAQHRRRRPLPVFRAQRRPAAVDTTDHILNGDGLKAGLRQLINERRQADLGASGLGRLVSVASSGGRRHLSPRTPSGSASSWSARLRLRRFDRRRADRFAGGR